MKLGSKFLVFAVMVTVVALLGCQNKENAAAGGSASAVPQPTADPHPPFGMFNTPGERETVPNKSWCTGWALDDSGISRVTGTTENGAVAPAKIDQPFPGVKEAYPNVPGNDTAGFMFQIPDLPPGPHSIKVEIVAKDGGTTFLVRSFNVQ
jgi:hypothetical protein